MHPLLRAVDVVLAIYQRVGSPDHGIPRIFFPYGFCRFYPSCSQYTRDALRKNGFHGIRRGVWRLLRCNPWNPGGIDEVK